MADRITRSRTKGWRMPENTVTVDRRTLWGNPFDFRHWSHCWTAIALGFRGDRAGRQAASVAAFRAWIMQGVAVHSEGCGLCADHEGESHAVILSPCISAPVPPTIAEIREHLRGKNLACWCKDGPCHADVLLEIANA